MAEERFVIYTVRVVSIGYGSLFASSDQWEDYALDSTDTLPTLAARLAREGFSGGERWIMPGAILWIKRKEK